MTVSGEGENEHAVGDILSSVEIINLAADVGEFTEWVEDEHSLSASDDLLEGYEFFMETAIRTLLRQIIYSSLPVISEDVVFFRARFEGIELAKIPNTCEKTAFIKNINDYRRRLRKADSWDKTQTLLDEFSEDVLQQFNDLRQNYTKPDSNLEMEIGDLLRHLSILNTFVHFNDVEDGYPNGYYISILETDLREERMEAAFEGYIYTLQFVWSELVEDELYQNSSLCDLHDSETWFHQVNLMEESPEDGFPDNRTDLDRFFGDVKEEVVRPLETETGVEVLDDVLFLDEEVPANFFGDLTSVEDTVELNGQEKFDYKLLWYQVEFLQASNIFNGVPAFISLLTGTVNLKKRFADGEEVYVCKFTHPVEPGNDFTYGVLVEASGSTGLADYSGWVMFYDCCGDYSGFAGSEHMQAERLIEEHIERGEIKLRKMELEKDKFQEFVSDKAIGKRGSQLSEELDLASERNWLMRKVRRARGLLVELISHYYLIRKGYSPSEVEWNISFETGELDILIETSDSIQIIECKYDPSNQNWRQEFDKLENKMEELDATKESRGEFWFWNSPPPETVSRLDEKGFEYTAVSEMIRTASEFRKKDLEHLQFVMEKADQHEQVGSDEENTLSGL